MVTRMVETNLTVASFQEKLESGRWLMRGVL